MSSAGEGATATIHDRGGGWIGKRPKPGFAWLIEHEAANYRALGELVLPIPRTHGVVDGELILERIDGPTLGEVLRRDPSCAPGLAAMFVDLWAAVHSLSPVDVVTIADRLAWKADGAIADLPDGPGVLCHFDFHPDNLILSADGPVIIDWADALAGPVAVDYARTLVLFGEPRGGPLAAFTSVVSRYIVDTAGSAVSEWMPLIAAARLRESVSRRDAAWLARVAEGEVQIPLSPQG